MEKLTSARTGLMVNTNMMVCMCCGSAFAEGVELELV
jgi:hypothetical protein